MKGLVKTGLIVYAAGALLACGQKGPLVLPDAAKRKHPVPVLTAPAAAKGAERGAQSAPAPTPAPAESTPATSPAPPASPTPPPN